MVLGLVLANLALFNAGAAPSLAVMSLESKAGVSPDIAALLSGHLADRMRGSGKFSRVITNQEIDAMLGLEKQKQLMQCDSQSCMAELAGALGVDFVTSGQVGKLGERRLITVSLINTKLAKTERSASRQVLGDEGALLDAMDAVAAQLLEMPVAALVDAANARPAAVVPAPATPSPAGPTSEATPVASAASPPSSSTTPTVQPTAQPTAAPATTPGEDAKPASGGVLGKVLMAGGGVLAVLGVLPLLGALASGVLAGVILLGAQTGIFRGMGLGAVMFPGFVGGAVAAGVGVLLMLGLVGAGVATLVAGVVMP